MSTYLHRVELQTASLQEQYDQLVEKEGEVRRLLDKADRKRRTPGEDTRKWSKVLTNLEYTLDDVRRRQNAAEVELNKARHALTWARKHPGQHPDQDAYLAEDKGQAPPVAAAPQVMNLEEMAALEGQLDDSGIRTAEDLRRQLAAEVEYANQTAQPKPARAHNNQRRQEMLRVAVGKIKARKFDDLSRDELQMTIATHSLLSRRLDLDANDERLLGMLSSAVAVLRDQLKSRRRT